MWQETKGHRWLNWPINQRHKVTFCFCSFFSCPIRLFHLHISSITITADGCRCTMSRKTSIEGLWQILMYLFLISLSSFIDTTLASRCLHCRLSSLPFLLHLLSPWSNYMVDRMIDTGGGGKSPAGSMRTFSIPLSWPFSYLHLFTSKSSWLFAHIRLRLFVLCVYSLRRRHTA